MTRDTPLRILFVSMEYAPETGDGIGSYAAVIAPALAARGHAVHVVSCVQGQATADVRRDGVWLHRRDQVRVPGLERIPQRAGARLAAKRLRTVASAHRTLRRLGLRCDVAEAPDWWAEGLGIALRRSTPLVGHLHTPLLLTARNAGIPLGRVNIADRLERTAMRRATLLTAPSRLLADTLQREGWLGGRPVEVIPLPIDVARWHAAATPVRSAPLILAVGRIEPLKGPDVLIRAAALLLAEHPDVRVRLVGRPDDPAYLDEISGLARALGVACELPGQVPRDELPAHYGAARVVALASRFDNFPMVALEAMATGRPVVCTSRTGTAELVAGTDAGAVVDADDPAGLAAALRPFLADAATAERAGEHARATVRERCSPARVAEAREAVYREAIARHARRRRPSRSYSAP